MKTVLVLPLRILMTHVQYQPSNVKDKSRGKMTLRSIYRAREICFFTHHNCRTRRTMRKTLSCTSCCCATDTLITLKVLLLVGYVFSWFSWIDQTTKFNSQRKGDFNFMCILKTTKPRFLESTNLCFFP